MQIARTATQLAKAFGYLSTKEVEAIKLLVATAVGQYKRVRCVNIGAGSGTSSLAIIEELLDLGVDYEMFSVDVADDDNPFGGLMNEANAFVNATKPLPTQIKGDSREVAKSWIGGPIDFIFIDDGHKEPEIDGDILAWYPHMNISGIMVFHDYGSPRWPDVQKVVSKRMREYKAEKLYRVDTVIGYMVKKLA